MNNALPFHLAGRIPMPGDNVAIASKRLDAGTIIDFHGTPLTLNQTVLEGHRFALQPIAVGEPLLSWNLPFGFATASIHPGDYVCNQMMLTALKSRRLDFPLPTTPNFRDHFEPYKLDTTKFKPGHQVALVPNPRTFLGYQRPGNRGAGTRNFIILIGTSSRTASFVRALEERLKPLAKGCENLDGIVAVAHTEGGGEKRPNNFELTLHTLAGFMVHSNVAAVLAVDTGTEPINNRALADYLARHNYPINDVPHAFHTLQGGLEADLENCAQIVRDWIPAANNLQRTPQPLRHLKLSLQCGGSDAFSGVSGNPLAGSIVKDAVRNGGIGNLCETDELVGAESHILSNVRDLQTAQTFLDKITRFEERVSWHGASSQTNPSGGNAYRGLYNIAIKSIGASRKKDPEIRLDHVIDFGDAMPAPGFYFMDSPGNDLESIAGQVAAGCNLILFSTGNGSITNFPFVPTIKIMTNSGRFRLLSREMDINAGRYLDGESFEDLARESFDFTLDVASGKRTAGERAGHAQVQLWREWRQTDSRHAAEATVLPLMSGKPIALPKGAPIDLPVTFSALPSNRGPVTDQIALIQPTSLCAGQVARLITEQLNNDTKLAGHGVRKFIALPHTEGCGVSGDDAIAILLRTMAGYVSHPVAARSLLLEHGCEKTHNDAMRVELQKSGINLNQFGWASIQLDGGIEAVSKRVRDWFTQQLPADTSMQRKPSSIANLRVALASIGTVPAESAQTFARITRHIVSHGGTIILASNSSLLQNTAFSQELGTTDLPFTQAYAQKQQKPGLHVMECPSDHWVETLTGLGATGAEIVLAFTADRVLQGHPLIPVLQVTNNANLSANDIDLLLPSSDAAVETKAIYSLLLNTAEGNYTVRAWQRQNTDFQVTRGLYGVST